MLAVAWTTHANEYPAAFSARVTIATISPQVREQFHDFGELVAELLKLGGVDPGAFVDRRRDREVAERG